MNVHRLIGWADDLLGLSPAGGARKGSILRKLRDCMDQLPSCRGFIKRFRDDAAPLLECRRIIKTHGLSHSTIALGEPSIQAIGSSPVRLRVAQPKSGDISTAFHCWAQFYLPETGWVVADPADVRKMMLDDKIELKDAGQWKKFFWGGDDLFRVALEEDARGVVFNPPQKGEPLDYFSP